MNQACEVAEVLQTEMEMFGAKLECHLVETLFFGILAKTDLMALSPSSLS